MKRRKWDVETIMGIVLEGLRGERSVAEICQEHRCSETQYYKWRDRFLDGGKRGLINRSRDEGGEYKAEIERLQKLL